jgi:hypothetical protein
VEAALRSLPRQLQVMTRERHDLDTQVDALRIRYLDVLPGGKR